jgi:UDP-2,4-diacetamido-2,4,6-trideoxy-beta-L-altropyranose hydrolase
MKVVFRTKGNHKQGMGDVIGSLAIADAYRDSHPRDAITFIVDNDKEAIDAVLARAYKVAVVDNLEQEMTQLKEINPDVIVVNMLKNDMARLRYLKQNSGLLVTIDDPSNAARWADIRINPLYYSDDAVTDPAYVALGKEFVQANKIIKVIKEKVEAILVTQGGADTYGFIPKIVGALAGTEKDCLINVVIGPAFKHPRELKEAIDKSKKAFNIIHNATNMCELMQQADLAITAGGNTMFELACVGVPAIVLCGEEFEEETAERMEKYGIVENLGFGGRVSPEKISERVRLLMDDKDRRAEMSRRGQALIDGRGAERIVKLIKEHLGG